MFKVLCVSRTGIAWVAALLLAAGGCGGGADFGESITVPAERHTHIDHAFGSGKGVRLPVDVPFNVADAQRFSQGDATAESSADASGRARCSAAARANGTAWAEFQLGHVFTGRGDRSFEATVTFKVTYEYRMNSEASAGPAPSDKFALKVYIMDSNRRVLKRMMLAELEPAKGPTTWSGTQSPAFDVTIEPGLAYHFVLAGRVQVSGDPDRSPSAQIEVKSLDLEVAPEA